MDLHGQFRRAAEQDVPEDEVHRFAGFLRFAIWTGRHPDGAPVGQLGGRPRLSAGSPALPLFASLGSPAGSTAQFKPDVVHAARFLVRREDLASGRPDKAVCLTEFLE